MDYFCILRIADKVPMALQSCPNTRGLVRDIGSTVKRSSFDKILPSESRNIKRKEYNIE